MRKTFLFTTFLIIFGFNASVNAQRHVVTPEVEAWVDENQERIGKMTRAEWQQLDEEYKWFTFTKLSPEQCHEFFLLKFKQVRDSFEWNEAERNHLDKILQLFVDNPDMYRKDDKEKAAALSKQMRDWMEYGMNELGWSQNLIRGIVMNCEDLLNKEGDVRVTLKKEK